jgi:hypothetical protein
MVVQIYTKNATIAANKTSLVETQENNRKNMKITGRVELLLLELQSRLYL